MSLAPGTRLGPYEIGMLIGAGGMGEVYRARDTRLNRDVALKVLPELFAADPDRLARFKREAQVLASLNHPNIGAIYGIEEKALALELVEGPTLADRIAQGPIPLDEALPIARQIADALEAAHEQGVIHRDLKPANIKLRPDGTVKVLDFGLAKAFAPDAGGSSLSAGLSMSPTITSPAATGMGMILGTAAYMSPEQARGKAVDKRSDIWAFGCIVFEMLTGRRPFGGDDVMETIAAVINKAPDWSAVPRDLPGAVRATLERCLQRDPKQRIHDIADARLALEGAFESRDLKTGASAPPRRRVALFALAALVPAIATGIVVWTVTRPVPAPATPIRFELQAPSGNTLPEAGFTLSPDGRHLAFLVADSAGGAALWIHSFDTGSSRPLPGNFPVANVPIWSPDSRQLAFLAAGKLRKIDIVGDLVQTIGDVPGMSLGSWNRDGVILFGRAASTIMEINAAGGTPSEVTALNAERQERGHSGPMFLPDGRHFLYTRLSTLQEKSGVFVGSLDVKPQDQELRVLVQTPWSAGYAPTSDPRIGYLFFVRDRTLFAQAFDNNAMAVSGTAVPVAEQIGDNTNATAFFSVSALGLAYRQTPIASGGLVWVDRTGRETGTLGPATLKRPEYPRLSPDGRRLAMTVDGDVWVYEVEGRPPIKLTFDGNHYSPLWTPDGRRIVSEGGAPPAPLLSVAADGSGGTPQPVSPSAHYHPLGWSSDGRWLVAVRLDNQPQGTRDDIMRVEAGNAENAVGVVQTRAREGAAGAAVSPDGRWLAYVSDVTGTRELWVQPFPVPGAPVRVSPDGGVEPVWAKNGRELYYRQGTELMGVAIDTSAGFSFKPPARLFTFANRYVISPQPPSYDVATDGRFLVIKAADSSLAGTPISVTMNWLETLRDLK